MKRKTVLLVLLISAGLVYSCGEDDTNFTGDLVVQFQITNYQDSRSEPDFFNIDVDVETTDDVQIAFGNADNSGTYKVNLLMGNYLISVDYKGQRYSDVIQIKGSGKETVLKYEFEYE